MTLDRTQTVAEIVLSHSECAAVFQAHRIDFCCRGAMSVEQACAERGTDPAAVFADLERAIAGRSGSAPEEQDPRELGTPALVARIISRHHDYLRRVLPFVRPLAAKVARVHGDHQPKLPGVEAAVTELAEMLEPHLDREEQVLFPALMSNAPDRALVERELAGMHDDHLAVGRVLERMRALADDYEPPSWACNSYRALMGELMAMEGDILRHVHLENHVLMPRFAEASPGPLNRFMAEDHERLHALLAKSVADPAHFDAVAFEEFRSGLLRHIGIEERILLLDARKRRGGQPLPIARTLRVEHGALASLLVPTPDRALVTEIERILGEHDVRETGPGGLYEIIEKLAGAEVGALIDRAKEAPRVPAAPHFDGQGAIRTAALALQNAERAAAPKAFGVEADG